MSAHQIARLRFLGLARAREERLIHAAIDVDFAFQIAQLDGGLSGDERALAQLLHVAPQSFLDIASLFEILAARGANALKFDVDEAAQFVHPGLGVFHARMPWAKLRGKLGDFFERGRLLRAQIGQARRVQCRRQHAKIGA